MKNTRFGGEDPGKLIFLLTSETRQNFFHLKARPYRLRGETPEAIPWQYPYGRIERLACFLITSQNDSDHAREGRSMYAVRYCYDDVHDLHYDQAKAMATTLRYINARIQLTGYETFGELVTAVGAVLRVHAYATWQREPDFGVSGSALLMNADGARAWCYHQESAYITKCGGTPRGVPATVLQGASS